MNKERTETMKNLKKYVSALLSVCLLSACALIPQEAEALEQSSNSNKNDMRAVWISTVYSADYPSVQNDEQKQKQEFITKLDEIKKMGLNTVVVQMRPKADAFYQSNINPWSEILTGTQGQNPGYDPMAFMIEEAHKRGIEFHAWLNPYRITTSGTDINVLAENHPARLHTDWVITYNNGLYYDPANEAVKQHICDTVAEIVTNYDVDAIHFDDYFYPNGYPLNEGETQDGQQANQRRANVNDMIRRVHDTIKSIKSDVAFGVSPMGIWKNKGSDSTGSDTKGAEGYYAVYGDVRTWIKNGYVDYIVPQIYWARGTAAADYETLVKWWTEEVKNTNVDLYIGQGIYKDDVAAEIGEELLLNEQYGVKGSFYFSLRDLLDNRQNCKVAVMNYYAKKDGTGQQIPTPQIPQEQTPETTIPSVSTETPSVVIPPNQNEIDNAPVAFEPIIEPEKPIPEPVEPEPTQTTPPVETPPVETPSVSAQQQQAFASATKVLVDSKEVSFDAYIINDFTYFKLRDVAMALNGTQKQFDTLWNETEKAINVVTNTAYTVVGGELQKGDAKNKTALFSNGKLYFNGVEKALLAYNIDGNTYFKLRDLAKEIDFGVAWNEQSQSIAIQSDSSYTE